MGLGNPGPRYARTRHNAGSLLVERLAAAHGIALRQQRHGALVGDGVIAGRRCLLALPQTFMNLSGESVQRLLSFTGAEPAALIVAHDDLDLPLGRLRIREGGGAGGHRGLASIIAHLGEAGFVRIRLGIGRPTEGISAEVYVLQEFPASDRGTLDDILERGVQAVAVLLSEGPAAAMNRFNTSADGVSKPPSAAAD